MSDKRMTNLEEGEALVSSSTRLSAPRRAPWCTTPQHWLLGILFLGVLFMISDFEVTSFNFASTTGSSSSDNTAITTAVQAFQAQQPAISSSSPKPIEATEPPVKEQKQPEQKKPEQKQPEQKPKLKKKLPKGRLGWTSELDTSSLHAISQQTSIPRGIVAPLFNGIAKWGISLLMHVRDMGVDLPVEVSHCGDLNQTNQELLTKYVSNVRIYDICELAAEAVDPTTDKPLFCKDLEDCHKKFRSFYIKLLSVVYSQYEEVMVLDGADVHFFQNPMPLWDSDKYKETGTLIFNDRIVWDRILLAERRRGRQDVGAIHDFMAKFDISVYANIPTLERNEPPREKKVGPIDFDFQPSELIVNSHGWNLRTGHMVDSSLLLLHKKKHQRALAILTSFISKNGVHRPPSYGDKEYFMFALEMAEAKYAFSDFGCGAWGFNKKRDDTVLCGEAAHYWPIKPTDGRNASDTELLYVNSNSILDWKLDNPTLYHTKARPAEFYPGPFQKRKLDQNCPFDIELDKINDREIETLVTRRAFAKEVDDAMKAAAAAAAAAGSTHTDTTTFTKPAL